MSLVALAHAGCADASTGLEGPSTRSYSGLILAATGWYEGDSGRMTVTLTSTETKPQPNTFGGAGTEYSISVTLKGIPCKKPHRRHPTPHCLRLSGTMNGSGIRELENPDMPGKISVTNLSGQITPLGAATANGRMTGTGYIARGHRTLYLVLQTANGTLSIGATGPSVRGFTPP